MINEAEAPRKVNYFISLLNEVGMDKEQMVTWSLLEMVTDTPVTRYNRMPLKKYIYSDKMDKYSTIRIIKV